MLNLITRNRVVAIAVGVLGLAAAIPAAASDSATVTVNATVIAVCKFDTSSATITIKNGGAGDTIDPSMTGDATGTATLDYRCSKGTTPGFSTTPASPTTVVCSTAGTCGTSTMPVSVTFSGATAGTGMGSGQGQQVTVTGKILEADYVNADVGSYTRAVTVDFTF